VPRECVEKLAIRCRIEEPRKHCVQVGASLVLRG
jgi:hypothetical protein